MNALTQRVSLACNKCDYKADTDKTGALQIESWACPVCKIGILKGSERDVPIEIKRFLLFSADSYDAAGGWDDLQATFDTLEEAEASVNRNLYGQIVDLKTGAVVKRF